MKQVPDYPTDKQIEDLFEAHKKGGRKGILELLNKMYPRDPEKTKEQKASEN